MKLEAIGIGDGVSFRVVNSSDFYRELNTLRGRYRLVVEKYRRSKSQPQLGYYYGVVLPHFHRAAIDQGWEFADVKELDNYLKSMFASKELINRHTGEILTIPGLKRDMTAAEMAAFTDAIKDYSVEFLGYRIPEPNEQLQLI
jgi:hypothetical protein